MAPSATSEPSVSVLGAFWEGLRQAGKLRLAATALEPSQGLSALGLLEGKAKVQKVKVSDGV